MESLQIAFVGLFGLASLTVGAPHGNNVAATTSNQLRSPYLNTRNFSYHCEDRYIYRCNNIINICVLQETCKDSCEALPAFGGVTCKESVSKVVKARAHGGVDNESASTTVNEPEIPHWNDMKFYYRCVGDSIYKCATAGNDCSFLKKCKDNSCKKFRTPGGAVCRAGSWNHVEARDIPVSTHTNEEPVNPTLSKCDGKKGTCYMCTPDRKAIYTCMSGFCYVQKEVDSPRSKLCLDSCNCCRKFDKRESIGEVLSFPKN